MNYKKYLPYIQVLAGFLGTLLLLFIIFDNWILPSLVRDRKIVNVPNLVGMKIDDATKLLISKDLDYKVVAEQYNENYPKDIVIRQNPNAGIQVKESRQILLTISKGKESSAVPYLINKQEGYAKNDIQNAQLSIGNITYQNNDSIPKGIVISQNPSPGKAVPYYSNVDLVISLGAEDILLMPNLVGKNYSEAQSTLNVLGLQIGEVNYMKNETFLPNTILKQNPRSGDTVRKNTIVTLILSK
jgi:serine/threonine-protein kinase